MRATRALLRRRTHLARPRGALLAHGPQTHSQYTLPAIGPKLAYQANRHGVAERLTDPAVQKSLAVDLALISCYEELLRDLELAIVSAAKHHDAHTLYRLRPVPGIGTILRRVLLYDIQAMERCPRGHELASYGRLVKCAKESAGKRSGTSGANIGNAHLPWAFSEAAIFFLRDHPAAQKFLARWAKKHRKGKAFTMLAHPWARAVYDLLNRTTACDIHTFLQAEGRGVGELNASLDSRGMRQCTNARQYVKHCVGDRP